MWRQRQPAQKGNHEGRQAWETRRQRHHKAAAASQPFGDFRGSATQSLRSKNPYSIASSYLGNKVPQNPMSNTDLKAHNTSITVPLPSKTTQNHSPLSTPTVTVSNAPGDCVASAVSFGGAPRTSRPRRTVRWFGFHPRVFCKKGQTGLRFWESVHRVTHSLYGRLE